MTIQLGDGKKTNVLELDLPPKYRHQDPDQAEKNPINYSKEEYNSGPQGASSTQR